MQACPLAPALHLLTAHPAALISKCAAPHDSPTCLQGADALRTAPMSDLLKSARCTPEGSLSGHLHFPWASTPSQAFPQAIYFKARCFQGRIIAQWETRCPKIF